MHREQVMLKTQWITDPLDAVYIRVKRNEDVVGHGFGRYQGMTVMNHLDYIQQRADWVDYNTIMVILEPDKKPLLILITQMTRVINFTTGIEGLITS